VDRDPWGKPYKIVMRKMGGNAAKSAARGRESAIADHLFPAALVTDWDAAPSPVVVNLFEAFNPANEVLTFSREVPEFTSEELSKACKRLSIGKAGGPTRIPNEALKLLATTRPRSLLAIYNTCLKALCFPSRWKRAKLVLLHKGDGKPVDSPQSLPARHNLETSREASSTKVRRLS